MNLDDYQNDPHAPRPKASQVVAAAHRAAASCAEPTAPIITSRLPQQRMLLAGGAVLTVLMMIVMATWQLGRAPARPLQLPQPTDAPAAAAFAPTTAPAPTPAPTAASRTIGAYASPEGLLIGQIEDTRAIVPVAHYGGGWVQANVEGSGLVWLRAGDVPHIALVGPDLAPVTPAPQTGRGLTLDQTSDERPEPAATPAPPAEPTPAAWPTSAPAAAVDFTKPDIKQTCQFVGCLGQNAVDLARAETCHALYWQYGDAEAETIPEPDYSAVRGCVWEGLYR